MAVEKQYILSIHIKYALLIFYKVPKKLKQAQHSLNKFCLLGLPEPIRSKAEFNTSSPISAEEFWPELPPFLFALWCILSGGPHFILLYLHSGLCGFYVQSLNSWPYLGFNVWSSDWCFPFPYSLDGQPCLGRFEAPFPDEGRESLTVLWYR